MALRTGHGAGAGQPRIEVLCAEEQPTGIPAPAGFGLPAQLLRGDRFVAGTERAREMARRGGLARAAKAKQLRALVKLGLLGVVPKALSPYIDAAQEFADAEVERLARECGGGVCPQNAAALVQQAALAMAGSRAAYAAGDLTLGARLGVEVRQNLLGARELTVREAQGRPKAPASVPWLMLGDDAKEPKP